MAPVKKVVICPYCKYPRNIVVSRAGVTVRCFDCGHIYSPEHPDKPLSPRRLEAAMHARNSTKIVMRYEGGTTRCQN
jgi:uncharacterized Zn finger protein